MNNISPATVAAPSTDPYGFLTKQCIEPVLVKRNHGLNYAVFYKNEWKKGKSQKTLQKMVGRIDQDNNVDVGRGYGESSACSEVIRVALVFSLKKEFIRWERV